MTDNTLLEVRRFEVPAPDERYKIEAVGVQCGDDLIVIVGGGCSYHIGSLALSLSMPSIKDPARLTNSTYQIPVPGHKEEALARESSLLLSRELKKNVVVSVGIHMDDLAKSEIRTYVECFNELVDLIRSAYQE